MKAISFEIKSTRPLLMHSSRGVNPLDPLKKDIEKYTKKRSKTDDDHRAIQRLEWEMSLYFNDDVGPYIPSENIERMMIEAARQKKLGKVFERAIVCTESQIPLKHKGPKDRDKLFAKGFYDFRPVVISRARIMRCRPKFDEWSATITLGFAPELLNDDAVIEAMTTAGQIIGLGDFRPQYGRFEVVSHTVN